MEPARRERRRSRLAGQGPELKLGAYTVGAYTVGASMRNSTRARPK
jgi:hypothetical protein